MFTGLIEKTGILKGKVSKNNMHKLTFQVDDLWDDILLGESIAANGVCLTVTDHSQNIFSADISIPTLRDTTLGDLKIGSKINLERSLKLGGRFGGHIVQGHVDGIGRVLSSYTKENNLIIKLTSEKRLMELITLKASIAIDGVSLTVQNLNSDNFKLVIIPHSAKKTNLINLKTGDCVNIEIDVFAKYVKHFTDKDKKNNFSQSAMVFFS